VLALHGYQLAAQPGTPAAMLEAGNAHGTDHNSTPFPIDSDERSAGLTP
jgi:hypothetical protein